MTCCFNDDYSGDEVNTSRGQKSRHPHIPPSFPEMGTEVLVALFPGSEAVYLRRHVFHGPLCCWLVWGRYSQGGVRLVGYSLLYCAKFKGLRKRGRDQKSGRTAEEKAPNGHSVVSSFAKCMLCCCPCRFYEASLPWGI